MSELINNIDKAICNIDGCLSSAGYNVAKSDTYGRVEKRDESSCDLANLSLIRNRLQRYKDVFLTDNCWPVLCNPDPCDQVLDFCGTDFVDGNDNVNWLSDSGSSRERWGYKSYNPDLGVMVSMTKADDDGSLPLNLNRVRFYYWENCSNTFVPLSNYIDTPDNFNKYFVYLPTEKKYYVIGDDWIMVLDSDFNVLSTDIYGGTRNWRSMTYDETRKEFYLCDNAGNELDILDYTTMTITSTTTLPIGVPTTFTKIRAAVYRDGGLLLTGWSKAWHMNVDTQAVTLIFDGDGTDYYYGTSRIDTDGNVVVLRTDIPNMKVELQQWLVDDTLAIPGSVVDLDLEYALGATTTALVTTIEYDACGNMYLIDHTSAKFSNREYVVLYNKDYEKQAYYTDFSIYGQETPFTNSYNPSVNKLYIHNTSPVSDRMLVLDISKKTKEKVNIYPEMCTPFTEKSVCDLIDTVNKICAGLCK